MVGIIKKLPYNEQLKLGKILQKEAKQKADYDKVLTHFASESVLAQDWELPEEGEAWKDL
nr:DUF2281 domain-containing protein [Bacteroidota bacterium]